MWLWPRLPFRPPKKDTGEEYPNSESQDLQFKEHFRVAGAWDGENARVIKCTKHGILTTVSPRLLLITNRAAVEVDQDFTLPYLFCSQVLIRSLPTNVGLCYVWRTAYLGIEGLISLFPSEWIKVSVDNATEITVSIAVINDKIDIMVEGI